MSTALVAIYYIFLHACKNHIIILVAQRSGGDAFQLAERRGRNSDTRKPERTLHTQHTTQAESDRPVPTRARMQACRAKCVAQTVQHSRCVHGRRTCTPTASLGSNSTRFAQQRLEQQDAFVKQLLDDLRAKDTQLQAKDTQLYAEVKENSNLRVDIVNLGHQLRDANGQILGLTGKRNLRGAVEFISVKIDPASSRGVQSKLDQLEKDTTFVELMDTIGVQHNIRLQDMVYCLKGLYHTLSKTQHGSEANLYIRYADFTAPAERAILVAIFEHHKMPYACIDETGTVTTFYSAP